MKTETYYISTKSCTGKGYSLSQQDDPIDSVIESRSIDTNSSSERNCGFLPESTKRHECSRHINDSTLLDDIQGIQWGSSGFIRQVMGHLQVQLAYLETIARIIILAVF